MRKSAQKRSTKKTIITAGLVLALVAGGGAAFAYWTTTGTGSGTAAAGANVAISVVQTSAPSNVNPGAAAQVLSGNFTNTNTGPVYVTSVTASIAAVTKATGAPAGACTAADYVLSDALMPVGRLIPAGTAQDSWAGAKIAFNNNPTTSQDACKNATITFSYVAA
ncbi:hypothetical protein [Cryobacterium sp. M15]|uniref:hypothetical protein n=1 Tax=Cryobacterium sp. M15 TaxID=2048291 RepID=UPI0011B06431|nr:hypothetical protein [Cryobacterium sp. M15]